MIQFVVVINGAMTLQVQANASTSVQTPLQLWITVTYADVATPIVEQITSVTLQTASATQDALITQTP